jgi:hypothetical protein
MEAAGTGWRVRTAIGLAAGAIIACVDNFAFGGEVSPMVIVILLLATTAMAGIVWGGRGWLPALSAWACVPLVHLVKHVLGLPDTIQPNTYNSILLLAAFTLGVALVGIGCGLSFRRLASGPRVAIRDPCEPGA